MRVTTADLDDQSHVTLDIQEQVKLHSIMVRDYCNDIHGAISFADNPDPQVKWGLLKVGCALANLTLIPAELVSDLRPWQIKYSRELPDGGVEIYMFLRANDYMRFL